MSTNPLLPILAPDQPRKSTAEKYGGLLYLGVAGLIALALLIGLFGYGVWSMRSIWADVYALNDARRSEPDRINAAWRLSRDERVTDRQRWDLAMNRGLPPLARYLLAEGLTAEATEADPRAYALALARSKGWPPWLRPLIMRPIVYAASVGRPIDRESLRELQGDQDGIVGLLAALARTWDDDPAIAADGQRHLDVSSSTLQQPLRGFAATLRTTSLLHQPKLRESLDATSAWLRDHGCGAAELWSGWQETATGMARKAAPELPPEGR